MSELDDIDAVIKQGEDALAALRRRRAEIVFGHEATDEDELRELARVLHDRDCRLAHEDQCAWQYEEHWMATGKFPMDLSTEKIWNDTMRTHSGWRRTAMKLCETLGKRPGDLIQEEKRRPR